MEDKSIIAFCQLLQNKKYQLLICPICKSNLIQITQLFQGEISFKCICKNHCIKMELNDFISTIKNMEASNQKCFRHKEHIANSYCPSCKFYMCEVCESYHSNFQPEHQTKKEIINSNDKCIVHSGMTKQYVCEVCDLDLCEKCKTIFHKDHINNVISIEKFYEKSKEMIQFKSIDDMNTKYLDKINELRGFRDKQINYLNSLINQILNVKEDINKMFSDLMQTNFNNMLLNKIVTDIFYTTNENNSIPLYNAIKNALCLVKEKANNQTFISGMGTYQFPSTGVPQKTAWAYQNQPTSILISKQITLENTLNDLKKENEKFFNNHLMEYKTKEEIKHTKKFYNNKYRISFIIKKKIFQCEPLWENYNNLPKSKISVLLELSKGYLAIAFDDKKIRIISQDSPNILGTLAGHTGIISSLCELQNGNLLSGSVITNWSNNSSETLREWNLKTFECSRIINNFPGNIIGLKQFKNGNIAIASTAANTIFIVEPKNFEIKFNFSGINSISSIFLILNKSEYLISASNYENTKKKQYIRIFDAEKRKSIDSIERNGSLSNIVQLKEENRIIFCEDKAIIIYNIDNKKEEYHFLIQETIPIQGPNYGFFGQNNIHAQGGNILHPRTTFTRTNIQNNIKSIALIDDNLICFENGKGQIEIFNYQTSQKELVINYVKGTLVGTVLYKLKNGKIIAVTINNIFILN